MRKSGQMFWGPPHRVESSTIDTVRYSREYQCLKVTFRQSGDSYIYDQVPERLYRQLLKAASKGSFFAAFIKGKFTYQKEGHHENRKAV